VLEREMEMEVQMQIQMQRERQMEWERLELKLEREQGLEREREQRPASEVHQFHIRERNNVSVKHIVIIAWAYVYNREKKRESSHRGLLGDDTGGNERDAQLLCVIGRLFEIGAACRSHLSLSQMRGRNVNKKKVG
jgi:hypothetical protein